MVGKYKSLVIIILLSLVIHEAGHAIVGGGIHHFRYAPELDPFSFKIIVNNWSMLSQFAGIVFTLPLLLFRIHPKFLFLILLFESRWDLLGVWADMYFRFDLPAT